MVAPCSGPSVIFYAPMWTTMNPMRPSMAVAPTLRRLERKAAAGSWQAGRVSANIIRFTEGARNLSMRSGSSSIFNRWLSHIHSCASRLLRYKCEICRDYFLGAYLHPFEKHSRSIQDCKCKVCGRKSCQPVTNRYTYLPWNVCYACVCVCVCVNDVYIYIYMREVLVNSSNAAFMAGAASDSRALSVLGQRFHG